MRAMDTHETLRIQALLELTQRQMQQMTRGAGILSGGAYIADRRMLWPLIFAHAAVDTLGLTALYLGAGHTQVVP